MQNSLKVIDSFQLKLIALITMIIDHIGAVLFPEIMIFRIIGRIAFPIYAFLLVQSFVHTYKKPQRFKGYVERMFVFALISEILFDLCFYQTPFYFSYQNVYFTLGIGLLGLYGYEKLEEKGKDGFYAFLFACVASFIVQSDYNIKGIILIFTFYFVYKWKKAEKNNIFINLFVLSVFTIFVIYQTIEAAYAFTFKALFEVFTQFTYVYLGMFLALIPIYMYNGKQGFKNKTVQHLFYWLYPIHIGIIYLISLFIR